jgi:hypothetical protein
MTHPLYFLDMIIPILGVISWQIAYSRGRIERWLYLSYGWGVLVGCLWEIPIGLLGNNFNNILDTNPLGFWLHINHALLDSFLLLGGLWCVGSTKRERLLEQGTTNITETRAINPNEPPTTTSRMTLTIFTCLELIQAFTVELLFNGHYWKYSTTVSWNPVLFWIHGIGYTLWPFLVWVIAPPLFYKGVQRIALRTSPKQPDIRTLWSEWGHLESEVGPRIEAETTTSYTRDVCSTAI